jgi:hypothetical protein
VLVEQTRATQRRTRHVPWLTAAIALATALLTVGAAPAYASEAGALRADSAGDWSAAELTSRAYTLRASGRASDWDHVRQVVGWLRYRKPPRRVVYLLGGSAPRESVISESRWSAQLSHKSGRSVAAYVLSSSCQTFVEDKLIIDALPRGRGVALISLGVTRFNMVHVPATLPRYAIRRNLPGRWYQHHYDSRTSLPTAQKRRLARGWVRDHYDAFRSRYPGRLAELEAVIQACEARGIRPVLLDMPLDLAAVGHDFDEAIATYQEGCLALAEEHDVTYLRFVSRIGLRDTEFYDLWHLLPVGRGKWQARLSNELVRNKVL